MWESFTNNSKYRGFRSDGIDENHPRFQDMCRWMYNHNPREYDGHMCRYDPNRYRPNPQQELLQQYRGRGIGQLDLGVEPFQQRMSQYYNGGYRQDEPRHQYIDGRLQMSIPVEELTQIETSKIKKMLNKIKIKIKW